MLNASYLQKQPVVLAWDLPLDNIPGYLAPKDIMQLIFMKLPADQLFTVRSVCRLWYQIGSKCLTLLRLFPKAPFFDIQVWERHVDLQKHGLVFGVIKEPRPTKRDYDEIKHMASQVEREEGISILVLPKGLTLNKIIAFAKAPKLGNATEFEYICPRVLESYGDQTLEKTITVVVTNGVFEGSVSSSITEKEECVKRLKCDRPEVVPFLANMILSYISSDPQAPLRRFSVNIREEREIYTLCEGTIQLGSFASNGPRVDVNAFFDAHYGVGGLRKFP